MSLNNATVSQRIVIAVDLDYFFAQCEEVRRPELKDKPVVVCVYSGRTDTSGAVSTANYMARGLGVKSGIPIMTAKKILVKHPEAIFLPVDHEYYDSVSERVMQIVRGTSPLFEQVSIDEAFVDVSSISHSDFDLAGNIAKNLKKEILTEEKLTCSIGVGPNKLIAKMGADYKKPDGLTILPPEKVNSFLKDLPVGKLIGIGAKTEKKMEALGIGTIYDLSNFGANVLAEHFGKNLGPHFKRIAQGIDNDPVSPRPIEQLSRIITLKQDANSFSFEDQIRPLVTDLSKRLQALKLKAKVIGIIAITSELKTKNRAKTLESSTDSYDEILMISRTLFHDFFNSGQDHETNRIRRAGIRVSGLEKTTEEFRKEGVKSEQQGTLTNFLGA